MNEENAERVSGAAIDQAAHALEMGTDLSLSWEELCTIAELVLTSALRAADHPAVVRVTDELVERLKTAYIEQTGATMWPTTSQFRAMLRSTLSCIEPLRPATEQAGGEVEPDYWAVHSLTGSHIGLWKDETYARNVLKEYEGGTITALYTSPAATQSAVVSDEMAANIAERILRNVRRFIAAENKHARLLSNPETELATSRDEADRENADLLGFTLDQVDQALRIVGRRLSALSNPGASQ